MTVTEKLVWNGKWEWELHEQYPGISCRQLKKQLGEEHPDMVNPRLRIRSY